MGGTRRPYPRSCTYRDGGAGSSLAAPPGDDDEYLAPRTQALTLSSSATRPPLNGITRRWGRRPPPPAAPTTPPPPPPHKAASTVFVTAPAGADLGLAPAAGGVASGNVAATGTETGCCGRGEGGGQAGAAFPCCGASATRGARSPTASEPAPPPPQQQGGGGMVAGYKDMVDDDADDDEEEEDGDDDHSHALFAVRRMPRTPPHSGPTPSTAPPQPARSSCQKRSSRLPTPAPTPVSAGPPGIGGLPSLACHKLALRLRPSGSGAAADDATGGVHSAPLPRFPSPRVTASGAEAEAAGPASRRQWPVARR